MLKYFFTAMSVMALVFTGTATAAERYPAGQLPEDVTPTHYSLEMTVVPDQERFSGKAVIDVSLAKSTDVIWLHGRGLNVSRVTVRDGNGSEVAATWNEIPNSDGVVRLSVTKPLQGPNAQIAVTYDAPFNRQLEGLYRSQDAGTYYAFSQMEAISARLAFPGFDEPRFKTPFDIALTVRAEHTAVSNTPEAKTERLPGGMKRVQFATTKALPTYLIALIVGPFDVVNWDAVPETALRDRVIPLRGIAAKGKGPQMSYALANTAGLLTTLEDYFGIPYPFEKLDIIAATDFSAGAMENAGAIVYRESLLLMDDNPSLSQKRRYVNVHAHEIAHHWFGNLVTPLWWNDIWLNEAFATWMADKAATIWDPAGEYDRSSLRGALGAMFSDSKSNTRRIAQPIETNGDIENAFDGITYQKGGGVLSMFEQYYGAENFRKGIKLHLERHAFGGATAEDFLKSIADANKDSKGVAAFQSFLNLPGVPLITAELKCSVKGNSVALSQARYIARIGKPLAQTQTWKVPLCIAHGTSEARTQTCSMLENDAANIDLGAGECPHWIMPNADGAGYFRFKLDKTDWAALIAAADNLTDKEVLATINSLDAAFDIAEMDIADYLDHIKALMARKDGNATWDTASALSSRLRWIKDVLVSEKTQPAVERYIAGLYGPLYDKIGLDPTSPLDRSHPTQATLLRGPVVSMMAMQARAAPVRQLLAERGAAYLGLRADGTTDGALHPEGIDPNMIDEVLLVAVQDRGKPVTDALFARLKTERDGTNRSRMLSALTRDTNPATIARLRALVLAGELRVNEMPIVVYGGMGERRNRQDGWNWFKTHFDTIKTRMPASSQGGLAGIGGRFCSAEEREDYKTFFEPKIDSLLGAARIYEASLESLEHCIALTSRQRAAADAYFARW